jgi:hypothetical protein
MEMVARWDTILEERDLAALENLYEAPFTEELKGYLLREFGRDGERANWVSHVKREYEKCLKRHSCCLCCGQCGVEHPYLQQSPLELITKAIVAVATNRLDPVTGKYWKEDYSDSCF